jgi:hydroxypyruvate isomerase
MKLAANLSFLFQDVPLLDRFARAARCGFSGVEILFPYDYPAQELARRSKDNGLTQALFNLPPGDWAQGERGLAAIAGREGDFRDAAMKALDYAEALQCLTLHCMAGVVADRDAALATYKSNLAWLAEHAAPAGVTVTIEPLNYRDMPGYLLTTPRQAAAIIQEIDRPNLKLQYDFYHAQIMEGDLTMSVRRLAPLIGHVQIAGVPDRHEPDQSETDIAYCLGELRAAGYDGWIGCEYRPRGSTEDGLGWISRIRDLLD